MVEGHQCHRVGHAHHRLLLGKRFVATSPNGRFAEGAAAISGKVLQRIEVHGKNLFYHFGGRRAPASQAPPNTTTQPQLLVDEDPLQPGALDSDSDDNSPSATLNTATAPLTPASGGNGSRRSSSRQSAAATPTKPALAAVGAAAAAALAGGGNSARPAAAAAAAAATASLAPHTPGSRRRPAAAAAAAAADSESEGDEDDDDDVVVVHIHFGMSGAFRTSSLPGPEPTPTTRLRLVHQATGLMAHLSAMTVAHGGLSLYEEKVSKLGPDPLRPGDDSERFWARVQGSKKPIGLLLMDQTAIAGVGNIYRAEILFKTGLHPEQPGHTVDRATFDVMWGHCVDLLQRGFTSGSILTVDPEDARLLGAPWTRRYIYNQRQCGRCKGPVKIWEMAARTVYCCETCQPLRLPGAAAAAGTGAAAAAGSSKAGRCKGAAAAAADHAAAAAQLLHPSRLKSMAAAKVAQEFVSHCAPDDPVDMLPSKMTCQQLRDHLRGLNMDTRGNKPALVARLEAAKTWMQQDGDRSPSAAAGAATAAAAAGAAAADEETELVGGGSYSGSGSDSGDELDRAEDALAARLSVPAAKRRRRAAAAFDVKDEEEAQATPLPAGRKQQPRSRTSAVAGARAAEVEKEAAGENRAVEHVALHADAWTDRLMFGGGGADDDADEPAAAATPAQAADPTQKRRRRSAA